MDLKSIKATVRAIIGKPSKIGDQAHGTEKVLKGSKSFCRGQHCEFLVAQHLKKENWDLIKKNFRTPYSEVDLLFKKQNSLLMVEVKSLSNMNFIQSRLRSRQKTRLNNSRMYIEQEWNLSVEFALIFVGPEDQILIFNEF